MSRITPSPTLAVMRRANELKAQGVDVIDFGPGEPDFITPAAIREEAKKAIDAGFTKYTDSSGTPELRKAIADSYNRRYGTSLGSNQVIVGCGGKQELYNAMVALVEEGDEVIIPSPYWVSFPQQVVLAGGEPVYVDLDEKQGFKPTAEVIEAAVTGKTRVVILNSPSNPTGAVIDRDELEKIVDLCVRHDLVLLYDETYEYFLYDGAEHVSAASYLDRAPENILIVNSFSKTYAMTGWRVGYAIGSEKVIKALGTIQSHSTSNATSIAQVAAVEAITGSGEDLEAMIRAYAERRAWLLPELAGIPGFECHAPGGAFYVFPKVSALYGRAGIDGSSGFSEYLVREARVAVVPGVAFGNDRHIRISYATSMDSLREGVSRIKAAAEALMA